MESRGEVRLASMGLGATLRDESPLSSSMQAAGAERAARHRAVCENLVSPAPPYREQAIHGYPYFSRAPGRDWL